MLLIQVKVIAGVFTPQQKRETVERLTDTMVEIAGKNLRLITSCMVEEIASDDWGIEDQALTSDDVKALARSHTERG